MDPLLMFIIVACAVTFVLAAAARRPQLERMVVGFFLISSLVIFVTTAQEFYHADAWPLLLEGDPAIALWLGKRLAMVLALAISYELGAAIRHKHEKHRPIYRQ